MVQEMQIWVELKEYPGEEKASGRGCYSCPERIVMDKLSPSGLMRCFRAGPDKYSVFLAGVLDAFVRTTRGQKVRVHPG